MGKKGHAFAHLGALWVRGWWFKLSKDAKNTPPPDGTGGEAQFRNTAASCYPPDTGHGGGGGCGKQEGHAMLVVAPITKIAWLSRQGSGEAGGAKAKIRASSYSSLLKIKP